MNYSLVVFDWDGTLMDTTGAIVHAIRQSAADLGLPVPSLKRAAHVIGLGMLDALHHAVPELPRERIPEYLERYRVHFFSRDAELVAFEGIVGLLESLARTGTWVAVATGKSRAGLNRALEQTGWSRYFVTTRTADEGAPKPDPWMLEDICEELGVPAGETVMIGDTTHDLSMAAAAGVDGIGVTYGAHPRVDLAQCASIGLVDDVRGLSDLLLPRVRR